MKGLSLHQEKSTSRNKRAAAEPTQGQAPEDGGRPNKLLKLSPRIMIAPEMNSMLLQPETRPITQEQLVNEVKVIYAGLVMVEKKCVEIDQQQAPTTTKLSNEQWQALTALRRTSLHEHHDFFLASQHPSSLPALRRLAIRLCHARSDVETWNS
jgi:hypothetical protein